MSNREIEIELEHMRFQADLLETMQQSLQLHQKLVDSGFFVSFTDLEQLAPYAQSFAYFADGVQSLAESLKYLVQGMSD